MKIIHCADIHLDSKIESYLPSNKSKQRKSEILLSFCDMVDFAKENGVTAVIIAGDLFDSNSMAPSTRDTVLGKIADAKGTDFLYLAGNHDAGKSLKSADVPENLKFFTDKFTSYSYENVTISGVELNSDNCRSIYNTLILDTNRFNIVTLHGGLGQSSGEQSVNETLLRDKGIDYLALGHYHTYTSGTLDLRGTWCYSGCLAGRGFDEYGDKGFVVLDIDKNSFTKNFVKCSHRDIIIRECDIGGLINTADMLRKIDDMTSDIDSSAMVKIVFTGALPEGAAKDLDLFSEHLKHKFYFAKIADETTLAINYEDYLHDISLKGEFIRLAKENADESLLDRIIECGLAALSGREVL